MLQCYNNDPDNNYDSSNNNNNNNETNLPISFIGLQNHGLVSRPEEPQTKS